MMRAVMKKETNVTDALIGRLLELHSALLEITRAAYEREHGAIQGSSAYLQLVTTDEAFAWLRPVSRLIVDLDDKDALEAAGGPRKLAERTFSAGNVFSDRYAPVLQQHENVVLIHGDVKRAIGALPA